MGNQTDEILETGIPLNGSGPATNEETWDLESLRLDSGFDKILGTKAVITTVSVRKPRGQEWFRVRPGPDWRLSTVVLPLKDEDEILLVAPELRVSLVDEIQPVLIFTAVSRAGECFLWPVRLPRSDGRKDKFIETDLTAARVAEEKWTRRFWVPEQKAHKILTAENLNEEPVWPEASFSDLLHLAFGGERFIRSPDHTALKRLRGEL